MRGSNGAAGNTAGIDRNSVVAVCWFTYCECAFRLILRTKVYGFAWFSGFLFWCSTFSCRIAPCHALHVAATMAVQGLLLWWVVLVFINVSPTIGTVTGEEGCASLVDTVRRLETRVNNLLSENVKLRELEARVEKLSLDNAQFQRIETRVDELSHAVARLQLQIDSRAQTSRSEDTRAVGHHVDLGARRRLGEHTCSSDGVGLFVDGICSCTEDILVGGLSMADAITNVSEKDDRISEIEGWICASDPFATPVHTIATNGASHWEHFAIDGTHYLAVANSKSDSSYLVDCIIYRFESSSGAWQVSQTLPGKGTMDLEYFAIDGRHYLAAANSYDGDTYQLDSVIYQYNETSAEFEVMQLISTESASGWEYFVMGDLHYLAVANRYDGITEECTSALYRYNASASNFEMAQEFNTDSARDWEYFVIGDTHYLAVANQASDSVLYMYDNTSREFEEVQTFPTRQAIDWTFFAVGNRNFLAVANADAPPGNVADSAIYQYNSASNVFELVQTIPTLGAHAAEHFVVEHTHYLAFANFFDSSTYRTTSIILRYSNASTEFQVVQEIDTIGGYDWEHFVIGMTHFLAVANVGNSTTHQQDSVIYRLASFCAT